MSFSGDQYVEKIPNAYDNTQLYLENWSKDIINDLIGNAVNLSNIDDNF